MKTTFEKTSIASNYSISMMDNKLMEVEAAWVGYVYDTFASAVTSILKVNKKKAEPVAFVFEDLKGNFKFAAIVTYEPGESDDMPGNWNYSWTFNEEDVADITTRLGVNDPDCGIMIRDEFNTKHGVVFTNNTYIYDVFETAINCLHDYLDANVTEAEELEIEFPGAFVASAVVEDGEKVFSITPSAALKQLIKDDKAV